VSGTSLEIKRKIVEDLTEQGLYPYSAHYLETVKERTGFYWHNHFSTIGIIGMNEALENLIGQNIASEEGLKMAQEIMHFMRDHIQKLQEETGHVFNLEATPAEGTAYRLAKKDLARYPDIKHAGDTTPYYTNSTQLPVGFTDDIFEALELQDELQTLFTGGTVLHLYLGEAIEDPELCKLLLKKIFNKYMLPYVSITPTFSICPKDGYLNGEQFTCPHCQSETEVYSRVTGYLRPIQNFNEGKRAEYFDRNKYSLPRV